MKRSVTFLIISAAVLTAGCASTYKEKPLPYKAPSSHENVTTVAKAQVAARAYNDADEAREVFGFDIMDAGMLPVQVVIDNRGDSALEINGDQTFLEDQEGNLWPILSRRIAYERATRYARTKETFEEGATKGLLGAAAGSIIGAAVGIVTGDNVGAAAGKGAAAGAAAGAVLGGIGGYTSGDAERSITRDLREKSLENKPVEPQNLGFGILFFPAEAVSGKRLRLQIVEKDAGTAHVAQLAL